MGSFSFQGSAGEGRYGDNRHSALPWGYWLTSAGPTPGEPPLIDGGGNRWASVREAFWAGRLGLPLYWGAWSKSILEFMASYLAITDRRFVPAEESVRDIFLGDRHFDTFFAAWMKSVGFVTGLPDRLTPEGEAVLLMLIATRSSEDAEEAVGMAWIEANRSVAPAAARAAAEDAVRRSEEVAARMMHRFMVDTIAGQPAVKLIGLRITRAIPVRSTVWSMSWPDRDRDARNQFYLWLLERIDRWDDWSDLVARQGSRALTEHLMRLSFCDRLGSRAAGGEEG